MLTPWQARFADIDKATIVDRTRVTSVPIKKLHLLSADVASERLRTCFETIFIAGVQSVRVIQEVLHIASAYSQEEYPDERTFMSRLYTDYIPQTRPAICLTGLAGSGKSSIMKAITRLIMDGECEAIEGHRLPLRAFSFVSVKQHDTEAAVFRALCGDIEKNAYPRLAEIASRSTASERKLRLGKVSAEMSLAQRGAYRDGISAILLDELQFLAQSGATTRISKTLLLHSYVGPPVMYAANFDMVHGLKLRSQQYRDRLLSRPIVLLPESIWDSAERESCIAYAEELLRVANGVLEFDVKVRIEALHAYSFGIRRKIIYLLVEAYRYARYCGRLTASFEDVEMAYKSSRYQIHREDVELLRANALGNVLKRRDLCCPFEVDPDAQCGLQKFYRDRLLKQTAEGAVRDSLKPSEEKALEEKRRQNIRQGDSSRKPERRRRMTTASAKSLSDGDHRFGNKSN